LNKGRKEKPANPVPIPKSIQNSGKKKENKNIKQEKKEKGKTHHDPTQSR